MSYNNDRYDDPTRNNDYDMTELHDRRPPAGTKTQQNGRPGGPRAPSGYSYYSVSEVPGEGADEPLNPADGPDNPHETPNASSYNLGEKKLGNGDDAVFKVKSMEAGGYGSGGGDDEHSVPAGNLHRQLANRHIAMISIGGVIGTGLFVGTGKSLATGGPLGLLLGYTIMGSIIYCVMVCLGEMVSHLPIAGGHITLATRFVDPSLAFTMGWLYWYNWAIALPTELSAAALLIDFWGSSISPAVFVTIFLIIVVLINLGGAKLYGEMEFWFASIKIITIVGLIILGIIITSGGAPDHTTRGFEFWKNPGPFVQYLGIEGAAGRFAGFWTVLVQAAFAFIGTEITAIAAGEARNPKRNLPKAIKRVYFRICFFYILGVFIIGILIPSNDENLTKGEGTPNGSPFVIAIKDAGIHTLPSIINAALLTSAWSAASSDLYTSSRALYSLSLSGGAPRVFSKTTSWGLPYLCVIVGFVFGLLAYMAAGGSTAGKVFNWLSNMTSIAGMLTWIGILWTYIRWHKGIQIQNFDRSQLPFKAPIQPWGAWYGLIACSLIVVTNGWANFKPGNWDTATFITCYLPVALCVVLFASYKFWMKTSFISYYDMDFDTNSRDAPEEDEPEPKNFLEKVWRALM